MSAARKQEDAWMSLREAASALGEGRFAVQSRIGRGELATLHIGKRTFIRRDSVDALIATRTEQAGRVA